MPDTATHSASVGTLVVDTFDPDLAAVFTQDTHQLVPSPTLEDQASTEPRLFVTTSFEKRE